MEHAASVLNKFASHTGHSQREKEEDASKLAQKYLAVHMRMVDPAVVYPFVADDFRLLSLRTHSPPLVSYCNDEMIDPETFVYLMKHGYPNTPSSSSSSSSVGDYDDDEIFSSAAPSSKTPALDHFRENMLPRTIGEEAWVDYERDDHWKARAYFLGLNFKNVPQYHQLVGAIFGDCKDMSNRANIDALEDFYSAMIDYEPHPIEAIELGAHISSLQLDEEAANLLKEKDIPLAEPVAAEANAQEKATYADVDDEKDPIVWVTSEQKEDAPQWKDFQNDPFVVDYRKRAGLNVVFSPEKTVKQMILSSLGFNASEVPGAERIVSKTVPLDDALVPVSEEAWPVLIRALDAMDASKHKLNSDSPALRELLQGGETNAMDTIKTLLTLYHPANFEFEGMDPRVKTRHLKKYPKIDESVIKSVLVM